MFRIIFILILLSKLWPKSQFPRNEHLRSSSQAASVPSSQQLQGFYGFPHLVEKELE